MTIDEINAEIRAHFLAIIDLKNLRRELKGECENEQVEADGLQGDERVSRKDYGCGEKAS